MAAVDEIELSQLHRLWPQPPVQSSPPSRWWVCRPSRRRRPEQRRADRRRSRQRASVRQCRLDVGAPAGSAFLTGGTRATGNGEGGTEMPQRTDGIAIAAFVGAAALAGGNAVGIRFSNRELPPLWGASLRFLLAAVLLTAAMAVWRLRPPRGRALLGAVLFGALTVGISFAFLYYALVHLQAGFVQTLLALVPLATLLLAIVEGQERFRLLALVGTVLAFAGIAVMTNAPLQASVPVAAMLATFVSVLCAAQGGVLVRAFPPVHPVTMNAVAMASGGVLLLIGALLVGERLAVPQRAETWAALGFLIVVDSILVSVLYLVILRYWDASRASYLFVVIPFATTALSAWLDAEPVTLDLILGGSLVLAGVYVGALRQGRATALQAGTDRTA